MAPCTYDFRLMSVDDLALVRHWLATPHVRQWWTDAEEFELENGAIGDPAVQQFIVAAGGRPFAYLQCYDQSRCLENGLGRHPPLTRGIDQFIGESDMVDRGHGSAFVRAFVDDLLSAGTPRVITDPNPANARAIRAYEKAGFRKDCELDTPDGRALLMIRDNPQRAPSAS
jgi:aminoglycoside 6'-N-acetyltransferase